MEKKSTIKNNSTKRTMTKPSIKKTLGRINGKENRTEKILVENFIALQKVIINMIDRFGKLGTQMEKLLNLFEASAEALAKKEFDISQEEKDHKKILDQIDNLLNQNKTIARSLALMHEVTHAEEIGEEAMPKPQIPSLPPSIPPRQPMPTNTPTPPTIPTMQKPMPPFQKNKPSTEMENYQASISSTQETNTPQRPMMPKMNESHEEESYAQ